MIMIFMRITVNLPKDLIKEAQEVCGFTSTIDVVIFALQEIVREKRIEKLKKQDKKVDFIRRKKWIK